MRVLLISIMLMMLSSILVVSKSQAGLMDWLFGYQSVEDCILGEIKSDMVPAAVRTVREACEGKNYGRSRPKSVEIFLETLSIKFDGADLDVVFKTPTTAVSQLQLRYRTENCFNNSNERVHETKDFVPPLKSNHKYQITYKGFKNIDNYYRWFGSGEMPDKSCIRIVATKS